MTNNVRGIKIEKAYGNPGEIGWSYEAKDESSGRLILDGEVERKGRTYHLLLRPNQGGREELEDVEDPNAADSRLLEILKSRARELLVSGKKE